MLLALVCGWLARFALHPAGPTIFYYAIGNALLAPIALLAAVKLSRLLDARPTALMLIAIAFGLLNIGYVAASVARRPAGAPITSSDAMFVGIAVLIPSVLIANIRHLAAERRQAVAPRA